MLCDKTDSIWNASWLWYPGTCWKVNDHFFARKSFTLTGKVKTASVRITAYTDYLLYINGQFIGRGPVPCDTWYQSFDTYDVAPFLREGKNTIGVLCHNYAIGLHWQHRGQGGLIAQLDIETPGNKTTVSTDSTWQVKSADCFSDHSPRQFWSMGFAETYDFRKVDDRWLTGEDGSVGWTAPEIFGSHPTQPWTRLIPREIPQLRETFEPAVAAEQGNFTLQNVHAIRFDKILPPGRAGIVYAQNEFICDEPRKMTLHLECDDAVKVFLNGEVILEKNYNQDFAKTRVWRAKDEYEQVHYGMGASGQFADITLNKGNNQLLLAVDHGTQGWGFVLTLLDPQTRRALTIPCKNEWTLAGPTDTTGTNDSLDEVKTDIEKVPAPKTSYSPFDFNGITDYATLMLYEERSSFHKLSDIKTLALNSGGFCIVDLGRVRIGFPQLQITSTEDAILDIGYTHSLRDDRVIMYYGDGRFKYVDRVLARPGSQTWQPLHRRTGRYLHISCRRGKNVRLQNLGITTIGYPVNNLATFECSDPVLNRIWDVSRSTTALLMQYGYQDCLKREQGTFNTSSFNYMSRSAACCFGDYDLARKTFRTAFRLQDSTGWFHSHGLSSPNNDEHVECLWLLVWLKDFFLYSGDKDFIRECFDHVEDNLQYFSRSLNRHGLLDERNNPIFRQGQIIYLDDSLSPTEGYCGRFDGEVSGINIMYYAALTAAEVMARELGLTDRADRLAQKAARVKRAFNLRFWNPKINRVADCRKGDTLSDIGHPILQIAALYFEICDGDKQQHLLYYLEHDLGLPDENKPDYPLYTFGFYYYFLEIFFRNNRPDTAYRLLNLFYGRWLELGPTEFGEFFKPAWNKGQKTMENEYEIHGYGTSAHLHFYNNLLGIRPIKPGFAEVLFKPSPGDLASAKGSIPTPQGTIAVEWNVNGNLFTMKIELPKTCVYKIETPEQFSETAITINNKLYKGNTR